MHIFRYPHNLLPLYFSLAAADYLTGAHPPPLDLTSGQSLVAAGWHDLSTVFDGFFNNRTDVGPKALARSDVGNLTFSLGMFSLYDPDAINLQYHQTAPEVTNAKGGTNEVCRYTRKIDHGANRAFAKSFSRCARIKSNTIIGRC